ncbi:SDR family NAD(P)-dependent oxidoreductase [Burkholderia multivorans]|uniref:SDR family NAD(P)-dependent oxidoreductase n=1 Tax=Burkholderia multivorans TaxID=87883 RepID=UPI001C23AD33|nr:SDR family NAD(P)-dependent oxidoreductase [Burkholderia multivorans]MBU9477688.1 SDR family oxidoreductase [Burkholderia multivorans]
MNDASTQKVCVVTGGAAGIGEAICSRFSRDGYRVMLLDINVAKAEATAANIPSCVAFGCDVADSRMVADVFGAIGAQFGRIDVLVNNAGIIGGDEYRRNFERRVQQMKEFEQHGAIATPLNAVVDLTDAQWERMLSTHLNGTFYCTRAAIPYMRPMSGGAIVNMTSIVGLDGGVGVPHYAAAKAGIIGFTRSVAQELGPLGIRVNAVAPGFIDTAMRDALPPSISQNHVRATPLGRLGSPNEIADAVAWLAGEQASFIVGQVISPNGGYLCR